MADRHLETFIQVADSGSFLKASEKLYISANAVAKQINLLEGDLNLKLFDRGPRGLVLTAAGELVYAEAKKLVKMPTGAPHSAARAHPPAAQPT